MVNTLRLRGDASTGWSMGWKINLWARALDGDHAHDILELALRHYRVGGGGISYNLYDQHPPFQIDGNFGATAGIAEMLMQSHSGAIHLLPALPEVWKQGEISGLKAIGDFEVAIRWTGGKATSAEILNNQGEPCVVKCAGLSKAMALGKATISVNGKAVNAKPLGDDTYSIKSKAGDKIEITF